jgi:site-specific recombinase XerD
LSISAKILPNPLFDDIASLQQQAALPTTLAQYHQHMQSDYVFAGQFLYSYRGSQATFNAYRREIERLLQWTWLIAKKSLVTLTRADIELFIEFCQSPPLGWIGTQHVPRFIQVNGESQANPNWRPFVVTVSKVEHQQGLVPDPKRYQLSPKAVQAVFAISSSFFNYLIQENYVTHNPVAQIRQKSRFMQKTQGSAPIRRLSELQWGYVIETALQQAQLDPERHERSLFIMQSLYGMYLRISELASSLRWTPRMGHFQVDRDGHWWFTTVGKGNKQRQISVSDAMLAALRRYRLSLGLTALPSVGDNTPLLANTKDGSPMGSTRYLRTIVQACFDASVQRLRADGHADEADQLMAATVHWLRHTGISDDVQRRPREHVRDDAGHGSSAITDRYVDVEMRARHASAKDKPMVPAFFDVMTDEENHA